MTKTIVVMLIAQVMLTAKSNEAPSKHVDDDAADDGASRR